MAFYAFIITICAKSLHTRIYEDKIIYMGKFKTVILDIETSREPGAALSKGFLNSPTSTATGILYTNPLSTDIKKNITCEKLL